MTYTAEEVLAFAEGLAKALRESGNTQPRVVAAIERASDMLRAYADSLDRRAEGVTDDGDALRDLVEACEAEFCCAETDELEPDSSKVAYPEDECHITFGHIRRARSALAAQGQPAEPVAQHPDDHHVEMFADDMKRKLAAARAKGRGGWDGDEPGMQQRLSDMLRAHVLKGDPCDVANFCMFLHQRGEVILPAKTAAQGEAPNISRDWNEANSDANEFIREGIAAQPRAVPDDAALLDQIQNSCWDLLCFDHSDGEGIGWRVIEHYQAEPHERVIAEVFENNPRYAIKQAMRGAATSQGEPA